MGGLGAEPDQGVEAVGLQHELSDVHRHVATGYVGNNDLKSRTVQKHGIHEGRAHVHPATGGLESLLDQVPDLALVEDRVRELGAAAAGDEHPAGLVDPDLLDLRIVQVALQGTEPGDGVVETTRAASRTSDSGTRVLVRARSS